MPNPETGSRPAVVSVVTPVYRVAERFLREALASVFAQAYPAIQVLVVNDGSPQDFSWLRQEFGQRVRLIDKDNGGPASARNVGIKESTGEFVAFLDADDIWEPGKLSRQLALFAQHAQTGLVYSPVTKIDAAGRPVAASHLTMPSGAIFPALFQRNMIPTSSVLVRRACLDKVGLFDEAQDIQGAEDYDLWLRIARDFPILCVGEKTTRYRVHPDGFSKDPRRAYMAEKRLIEKAVACWQDWDPSLRSKLPARMAQLYFDYGHEHYSQDQFGDARRQFLEVVRHRPADWRAWGYLLSTFGGRPLATQLRAIRARFRT